MIFLHIKTRHNVATISTSACTTTTQHIARHFLFSITAATMLLLCVRHTVPKYKQKKLNHEHRPKNYSVTKHTHTRAHSLTHTTHRSFRVRVYAHIVAGHHTKRDCFCCVLRPSSAGSRPCLSRQLDRSVGQNDGREEEG